MAIISTNTQKADVHALGKAMDATVNINGSLMEMLSTVYIYILMAAIREAIQNGSDAARRAGFLVSDGVLVHLPTPSNPMFTVVDRGSGMTKDFMENDYLSLGSSTKAGDNGSAGGLGIGRWAAYGYIREAYITTCHASDMVERTFFQFQGPNGKPQVQLASEVPGTVVGTKVYFPVKETDMDESLRAVAWLKEVMQLTMGDSFTVDNPAALPTVLPKFCGTVLTLEAYDPGLQGVKIYPMQGSTLKYGRQGLQDGSLVVLVNKDAGVGGLPFHVQSPSGAESVFASGMVVEIPMSFNIPFMPSREEIKYTDEVNALLTRIDAAAATAIVVKATELFSAPDLASKAQLSEVLGNTSADVWHWFSRGVRTTGTLTDPLRKATGGETWHGDMRIPFVSEMASRELSIKSTSTSDSVLRSAFSSGGNLAVSRGKDYERVSFHPNRPFAIVVNDLKSGGTARFRKWLGDLMGARKFVFLSSTVAGEAQAAGAALNAVFGEVIEVFHTSKMPEVERVIFGSSVVASRSRKASLTYYSVSQTKQVTDLMSFATHSKHEPVRVWLGKDGGNLAGFKDTMSLVGLTERYGDGNLKNVLTALKLDRLYLLTPKQVGDLDKAQAEAKADGVWDLDDDDFADDEAGRETMGAVKALKSWKPFEVAVAELLDRKDIQATLAGTKVHTVKESWEFNQFCDALARRPRMELTGTSLDKTMAPHLDLLTGDIRIHRAKDKDAGFRGLCSGLVHIGQNLEATPDDSDERKELLATLSRLNGAGHVDYCQVFDGVRNKYPLLHALGKLHGVPDSAIDHFCQAFAAVYR